MIPATDMTIAILAGGASRRMGQDKARLDWGGRPLLGHILEIAREAGAAWIAVAGRSSESGVVLPPGTIELADAVTGCGPVGGLIAVLRWQPRALVLACDMPHLTAPWLRWLWNRAGEFAGWTAPSSQPLCAVYSRAVLPWLERAIAPARVLPAGAARHRRVGSLSSILASAPRQLIAPEELARHGFGPELFLNLNTPAEYAAARADSHVSPHGRAHASARTRAEAAP